MKKYTLFLVVLAFSVLSFNINVPSVNASDIICPNGNTLASNCTASPAEPATEQLCPNGNTLMSNCTTLPSTGSNSVVINGVKGPQSFDVNETGTWAVSAYNKNGGNLSYHVDWGDEPVYAPGSSANLYPAYQPSATFTHSYSMAGIYNPTFTVTSENTIQCIQAPCPGNGGKAQTSLSVNVGNVPVPALNSFYISPSTIYVGTGDSTNVKVYYQPPMPPCPGDFACAQAMPAPYPVRAKWSVADTSIAKVNSIELPCVAQIPGTVSIYSDYCVPLIAVTGVSTGKTLLTATYTPKEGNTISASATVIVDGVKTESSITVRYPKANEIWQKGTKQTIAWSDTMPPIRICPVGINCTVPLRSYDITLNSANMYPVCTSDKCPMYQDQSRQYTIAKNTFGSSFGWLVGNTWGEKSYVVPDGFYWVKVCQSGTSNCGSSGSFNITNGISTGFTITNQSPLPNAQLGNNYNTTLYVSGAPSKISTNNLYWSVVKGKLPPGLTLSASDYGEIITGTPTAAGTYPFTLEVSLSKPSTASLTADKDFIITVVNVSAFTVSSPRNGDAWAKGTTQTIKWKDSEGSIFCGESGACQPQVYDISLQPYYPYPTTCNGDVCSAPVSPYPFSRIIATGVSGSSYNWTIPNCSPNSPCSSNFDVPAGAYTVKVCRPGGLTCGTSDGYFKITNGTVGGGITVLSPNGGVYYVSDPLNVSWTAYKGDFDNYYVMFGNKQSGVTVNVTPDQHISKYATSYTITNLKDLVNEIFINSNGQTLDDIRESYYIEVMPAKFNSSHDTLEPLSSLGAKSPLFTILPSKSSSSVTVLSPNGGETWTQGTTQTIKWHDSCVGKTDDCFTSTNTKYDIALTPFSPACTSGSPCPLSALRQYIIALGAYGNSGDGNLYWKWIVGSGYGFDSIPEGAYTIRICQSDTGVCGVSSSYFKIVSVGTPPNANHAPQIGISTAPTSVKAGQPVTFSWSATDADNNDLSWSVDWEWGNGPGSTSTCVTNPPAGTGNGWNFTTSHSWVNPGTYTVKVSVIDCHGGVDSKSMTVVVENATSQSTNVALGRPVSQFVPDAVGYASPASNLTDGNSDTAAYPGQGRFSYEVDLGSLKSVSKINALVKNYGFNSPNVYITSWQIQGTDSNGRLVDIGSGGVPSSNVISVSPTVPISKIRVSAQSTVNWIGIYELEAYSSGNVLGASSYTFMQRLERGSAGDEVAELQLFLTRAGYDIGIADGRFGAKTEAALTQFQSAHNLKNDGIFGTETRAFINQ